MALGRPVRLTGVSDCSPQPSRYKVRAAALAQERGKRGTVFANVTGALVFEQPPVMEAGRMGPGASLLTIDAVRSNDGVTRFVPGSWKAF